MKTILDKIGFVGPIIITLIVIIKLREKRKHLIAFIIGLLINVIINKALKKAIKQERPKNQIPMFETENKFYKGEEQYGFPSQHAQITFYVVTYLYLVTRKIDKLSALIGALTIAQRIKYRRHSIEQIIGGGIIGIVIAYTMYFSTK